MSGTGFLIFNKIFELGATLLHTVCLTMFFGPFLTEQRHRRKILLLFSACLAVDLICGRISIPQGTSGLFRILLLMGMSGVLGLEKATAFLLSILYWNTRISSALMAESLYFIADQQWPLQAERPDAVFFRSVVLLTALLLLHAFLLIVMLRILRHQVRKRPMPLHWRELCCLSLIPAAGILFGQMISRLLFEPGDGVLLQLYERHPIFLAMVPLMALLFYAGAYLTIRFQQGMAALREEQANYYVERQQTQAIRVRIHEVEQFYISIRQLKHEMRGHLNNIRGLARSGEYASLEDYISQIDGNMADFELKLRTGNPVTDVILSDLQRQCREKCIRFQTDFHYPEARAYDAFDLGIILQNLLQNALEACEKIPENERFISLTGRRNGHFFLIEVKNPFAGEIIRGTDGLPVTTKKEDVPMHGIGLSNVRRTAEKYLGGVEISLNQGLFRVTVMMQEKT